MTWVLLACAVASLLVLAFAAGVFWALILIGHAALQLAAQKCEPAKAPPIDEYAPPVGPTFVYPARES